MAPTWWRVLEAAREVGSKGKEDALEPIPFTAADLATAAGFKATKKSRATDIAAGWISKLVRWGYVRALPVEDGKKAAGRPRRNYELTEWGLTKKAPRRLWWQAAKEQKRHETRQEVVER
jgi:hypothetical protein